MALALILEAYTGVSDDEVIEATVMDQRGGRRDVAFEDAPLEQVEIGELAHVDADTLEGRQDHAQTTKQESKGGEVFFGNVCYTIDTFKTSLKKSESEGYSS